MEEQILKIEDLAPHYEIHVEKDGNLDCVTVRVERKPESSAEAADVARALQQRVKTHIGISTKVEVADTGSLARSEGKAKHVFDRRLK